MKKILILLIAASFTGFAANAQTDTTGINYRYYPEANVYFNPTTKTYSWYDQNTTSWTTGIQLPMSVKIKSENTYNTIRYPGTDVWSSNPDHIKTYGNQNAPEVPRTSTTIPPQKATTVPPRN